MKSSLFDRNFIIYCYFLISLYFNTGSVQQTSAAAIPELKSFSLYNANDKLSVLVGKNFSTNVYHSDTAWLVEFYASWCGHCQAYAKTYREIAIDTWAWQKVVRVGAINCYSNDNEAVCTEHNIKAYPTLRLIPPRTTFENHSEPIGLAATDAKNVEKELITKLSNLHTTQSYWPYFKPANRVTLEELYARAPSTVKLVILIVENRDDYTGRQVMLDFSKYHDQLAIFRTTTDGKLWRKLHLALANVPALFIIHRNRTAERMDTTQNVTEDIGKRNLFNYALRSYIHRTRSIENFDDRDLEEIILSIKALKEAANNKKTVERKNEIINQESLSRKVNMIDLELALVYMFRREISRAKEIQGDNYDALIQWLNVLIKYFPGRKPVMAYLKELLAKVKEQSNDLTGSKFRAIVDANTYNAYLPSDIHDYRHCTGSSPKYRGYPCAVWLLFHTLTVAQVQAESDSNHIDEIPLAVRNYVKHFFGCRHCSENFMKETDDIADLDSKDKYAAVVYLWKIHNHVNKRLHGDITEDPIHPKIQFPSGQLCSQCQSNKKSLIDSIKQIESEFNLSNTIDFLMIFYSKTNIDMDSIENMSIPIKNDENKNLQSRQLIAGDSMIELNDKSTGSTGIFRIFPSIIQRFPFYILICLLAIVGIVRYRYFKVKNKRYTL